MLRRDVVVVVITLLILLLLSLLLPSHVSIHVLAYRAFIGEPTAWFGTDANLLVT